MSKLRAAVLSIRLTVAHLAAFNTHQQMEQRQGANMRGPLSTIRTVQVPKNDGLRSQKQLHVQYLVQYLGPDASMLDFGNGVSQ